jgi:hypothetical protein
LLVFLNIKNTKEESNHGVLKRDWKGNSQTGIWQAQEEAAASQL